MYLAKADQVDVGIGNTIAGEIFREGSVLPEDLWSCPLSCSLLCLFLQQPLWLSVLTVHIVYLFTSDCFQPIDVTIYLLILLFLGLHLWHMEVPWLGVESEPQLPKPQPQ